MVSMLTRSEEAAAMGIYLADERELLDEEELIQIAGKIIGIALRDRKAKKEKAAKEAEETQKCSRD